MIIPNMIIFMMDNKTSHFNLLNYTVYLFILMFILNLNQQIIIIYLILNITIYYILTIIIVLYSF